MRPAFKTHSCSLFTATAAVVLGLQGAPWPSALPAQELEPAPLIVQAEARPITPSTNREQRPFNNAQRPSQPAQQPVQQPAQQRAGAPQYPKSEVQRELEKLYEQNGREVPEMVDPQFTQPAAGQPGTASPAAQPAPAQLQSPPQSYQAAPVSAPKKKGLFGKLFGSKNDAPTQPPAEPLYAPPASTLPATPPAMLSSPPVAQPVAQPTPRQAVQGTGRPNYGQLFNQTDQTVGGAAPQPPQQFVQQPQVQQPLLSTPPAQPLPSTTQYQPSVLSTPPASAAPADDGFEAPLFVETPAQTETNGLPAIDFNAPLVEPDTVDLGQPAPLTAAKPVEPADPFSDDALFPGASAPATAAPAVVPNTSVAREAAPVEPTPPAVEEAPVDENPYSGLTLDADPFSIPSTRKAATAAPREIPIDDPVVLEETVETDPPALMVPPEDESDVSPRLTEQPAPGFAVPNPEQSSDEPPLVVEESEATPPAQLTPVPQSTNERTLAKQEMIAARKGLRGLKGFCPVVLREDRDLVDAHSQFRVIYNSKTYYLSSSQAVTAFHSDPAKYAPAARGSDVIHQAITGEEIEGTLDFAVWYKGRLYLFSSAETMDTFISAPSSHATLD